MNKQEFFAALRKGLSGLPEEDIERSVDFYGEMIDDRIEDGLTEEQAIADIDSVEKIVKQTLSEIPLAKLVKAKAKPKRALKVREIVLLVLGSPVWIPLVLAAALILLSVYIVIWSVVVSLYAVDLSFAVTGVSGIVGAFAYAAISSGNMAGTVIFFGTGLICAGLSIFMLFGFNQIAKWILLLSKKILLCIKSMFIRKGEIR